MTVAQSVTLFVSNSFKELINPYGGVDSEAFLVQSLDFDGTSAGLYHRPETGDTHLISMTDISTMLDGESFQIRRFSQS